MPETRMWRLFSSVCLLLPALVTPQDFPSYLRPQISDRNIPRHSYNVGLCGARVCGSNGRTYRGFESFCAMNEFNLKLILSGQREFELTDSIYCYPPPPPPRPRNIGSYYNDNNYRSWLLPQSHRSSYSSYRPTPCNHPEPTPYISPYSAVLPPGSYPQRGLPGLDSSLPYPFWTSNRPAPPVSYRQPYWHYPTRGPPPTRKPCSPVDPKTTPRPYTKSTSTEAYTTTTTPATTTTTEKSTTEIATTEKTTTENSTTENITTENTTEENSTTENITTENSTTENSTTENPTTENPTTENSTTENITTENSTTENSTTENSTTENSTTEISTTENITTENSTTEISTTENSTTENSTTEISTTENSTTENSTTENPTTENPTTENSTTEISTTENITTSTETSTTTTDPSTTSTTTEVVTTTTAAASAVAANAITIEIKDKNGKLLRFALADLATDPETGEPNCSPVTNILVTTGSKVVFQFSGCIQEETPTTTTEVTTTTTTSGTNEYGSYKTPYYQSYGSSYHVIQY